MTLIGPAIFILLLAIISVPIANRAKLPLEVFLIIGSCIISLLPWLPSYEINPQIVFNIFLPPILFYAAYFTSWHDFKINLRPISFLAVGLVIFTMIIVAIFAKLFFPQLSWAESFLLGAVISPTDAASATVIIKKLGAPRRIVTILEGESLINDATALILFRFALIAVLAGSFSLSSAIIHFFVISIGGVVLGFLIAFISVSILQKIRSMPAETTLTMITAFTAYILGEHLGFSGVIATVVGGIYFGLRFPKLSTSRTRIHSKASWDTLLFIINGFIFTLIGLELPTILKNLNFYLNLILSALLISVIVILTRIVWIFAVAYFSRALFPSIAKKDPMPPWPVLLTLGWCGMRGIVSLAAALSIPLIISPTLAFANRDLIVFITYCVIFFTILAPAFTLQPLLKFFNILNLEDKTQQEAIARIRSLEGIVDHLNKQKTSKNIPENIFKEFITQVERRLKILHTQLNPAPFSTLNDEYQAIKILTFAAIESERNTLFKLRKLGEINDEIFHLLLNEIDLEEMRAKTIRI